MNRTKLKPMLWFWCDNCNSSNLVDEKEEEIPNILEVQCGEC